MWEIARIAAIKCGSRSLAHTTLIHPPIASQSRLQHPWLICVTPPATPALGAKQRYPAFSKLRMWGPSGEEESAWTSKM